jgi:hypothetical protein
MAVIVELMVGCSRAPVALASQRDESSRQPIEAVLFQDAPLVAGVNAKPPVASGQR